MIFKIMAHIDEFTQFLFILIKVFSSSCTSRTFSQRSMTKSTSSSVVNLPMPKRMEVCASSSPTPMARRTYDGSSDADVQADPDDTAMFFNDINSDSPSTYAKEKFRLPGYRCSLEPFSTTSGMRCKGLNTTNRQVSTDRKSVVKGKRV